MVHITWTALILLISFSDLSLALRHGQRRSTRSHRSDRNALQHFVDDRSDLALHSPARRAVSGWQYVDCVNDGPARALTGDSIISGSITVDSCIQRCESKGFTYAGMESGNQCYCGNTLSNGLGTVSSPNSCYYTCAGDSSAKCGGAWKMSLYRVSPKFTTTPLGCYRDGGTRTLTGPNTSNSRMSPDVCASFCVDQGMAWFGVEYGTQCFCSATLPDVSKKIPDASCNSKCAAGDGSICGGSYALSVYSIAVSNITTAKPSTTLVPSTSITSSKSATTFAPIAATTSQSSITSTTTTKGASTTAVASTTPSPVPSGLTALGCFDDVSTARLLNGTSRTDDTNTITRCATWCSGLGFKYSGVEYGYQCFCGNSYDATRKKSDTSCSFACTGDSTSKCGGSYAMNLFSIGAGFASTSTVPSTTSTIRVSSSAVPTTFTPPAASPSGLASWGCFSDGSTRLLNGTSRRDAALTPTTCATWCASQGYTYMGLEYGSECYCGSSVDTSRKVDDSRCTSACSGNSAIKCGGAYLANVYSIGSKYYTSTSSSVVTTTAKTSAAASSVSATTTSARPAATTIGYNAACTSVVGVPAIPSSGTKQLWAHHMVGNTYSYTPATWQDDINQAAAGGFDGFALNHGSSDWQFARMDDAYAVAQSQGSFKLFLSIDVTAIGCSGASDAQRFADLILRYSNYTSQATVGNKTLVSTFSGDNCYFGQPSVAEGWNSVRSLVRTGGREIYLMPAIFVDPNSFSSMTWYDGLFNWDSGWPMDGSPLTVGSDETWMSRLAGKGYMPAITPLFFTYYGANSWNKNWIYRSDDWLMARRFEQVIAMRDKVDMAELISWNDYGESHYVGPIRSDQPNSQGWVDGFPHTAWLSLINYYAQAFKYGSYPSVSSDTIWLWTRPHFKGAVATAPTVGRPNKWDNTDDNLYVLVLLASPATVTINSGANVGTWSLKAGVNKLSIASAEGSIGAIITRSGKAVKSFDSAGQFSYTNTPIDYNYNYWLASL